MRATGSILLSLAVVGCSSPPQPAPERVRWEMAAAGGREASAAALLQGVRERLAGRADGDQVAARWAARFPAEALEVLRAAELQRDDPALALLARVCDAQRPGAGWALRVGRPLPDDERAAEDGRRALRQALGAGDAWRAWELVGAAPLPTASGPRLDALELRARACESVGRDREACGHWAAAVELARRGGDWDRAGEALLRQVALRQVVLQAAQAGAGGDEPGEPLPAVAWEDAALAWGHAPLLADPSGWERLLLTRPGRSAWPPRVGAALLGAAGLTAEATLGAPTLGSAPADGDGVAWLAIGRWRAARGEDQGALAAFARAESSLPPALAAQARLGQARALLDQGAQGAAATILGALATDPRASVSEPASALLGGIYLRQRRPRPALPLLRAAQAGAARWEGRAEAAADLGLCYLSLGEEGPGLHWLREAQAGFRAEGQRGGLRVALENERRWQAKAARADEVLRLERELAALRVAGSAGAR